MKISQLSHMTRQPDYLRIAGLAFALAAICALASCTSTQHTQGCPQAYGYKNTTYNKPFINH